MIIHSIMAILIMGIQIPMNGFMTNFFYGKVTNVFAMAHQTQKSREIKQTPKQNRKTKKSKETKADKPRRKEVAKSRKAKKKGKAEKNGEAEKQRSGKAEQ